VLTLSETVPWKLWATRPEIRMLADLKGKAVGVQTRGDLFELSMRAVLRKAGLDEDFVAYIPLGFGNAQRLGVVASGSLPAILLTNFEERIARERSALGQSHILLDVGKDVRIPNNGLATSDRLIAASPSVAERLIRATIMGMRYMKLQRAGALRMFAQRVPDVPIEVLRASIDDTAKMLLDDGATSPAVQDAELTLRGSMMGKPPNQVPTRAKVFDYSLALQAAQTLRASQWVPGE
jgi:ABC-type nitrate/sulfonate/bicarbonate transport system substrate-binding protein